jgi:hypothetical protein
LVKKSLSLWESEVYFENKKLMQKKVAILKVLVQQLPFSLWEKGPGDEGKGNSSPQAVPFLEGIFLQRRMRLWRKGECLDLRRKMFDCVTSVNKIP